MAVVYDDNNNTAIFGSTEDRVFYGLDGHDFFQINFVTNFATTIEGGDGNDVLLSSQGNDFLYGGNGNDRLDLMGGNDYGSGGAGSDIIVGDWEDTQFPNSGVDKLYGGDGDDDLRGGGRGDFLYGEDGNDTLSGDRASAVAQSETPGNDRLYGGEGNDKLFGQSGDDVLDGGNGRDLLTGGIGKDVLIGGLGADRFIFTTPKDSPPTSRDFIYDFRHGQDRIDLFAIDAQAGKAGNQPFVFIGSADFSGARGELRYERGIIYADVNGNQVADLLIRLDAGPASMFANDFIL